MKKLLIAILMMAPMSLFAQAKFAHFNSADIIPNMKEYNDAQTELQKMAEQFEADIKIMQDELQKKSDDYQKEQANLLDNVKQRREQELQDLYQRLQQSYQDNQAAIQKAQQLGAKPVTCSDSTGWIYDPEGIDVALLKEVKEVKRARLTEYAAARPSAQYHDKATEGTNVIVALDIGPLSELMEPYGDLEEDEVAEIYTEMMKSGIEAGAKAIFFETFIDLEMMRVAVTAAKQFSVPVFCSFSFEKRGKTIMGNSVDDIIETLSPLGIDAIGMNCSLGPDLAVPIIKEFASKTSIPLIFKPNAGLPIVTSDGKNIPTIDASNFVSQVEPSLECVSYVGGCCGSSPLYIEMLRKRIDNLD